jgi:hypothetical protein
MSAKIVKALTVDKLRSSEDALAYTGRLGRNLLMDPHELLANDSFGGARVQGRGQMGDQGGIALDRDAYRLAAGTTSNLKREVVDEERVGHGPYAARFARAIPMQSAAIASRSLNG